MSYRSYNMLTIMGFLALLPDVRRGLARKLLLEWEVFGDALEDVFAVKDYLAESGGYYFLLGNRAAAAVITAYQDGRLPMKAGTSPGNPWQAQRYVDTERRVPDFVDPSLHIVRGVAGAHGVQRRISAGTVTA